jgi:hypothetical protein
MNYFFEVENKNISTKIYIKEFHNLQFILEIGTQIFLYNMKQHCH